MIGSSVQHKIIIKSKFAKFQKFAKYGHRKLTAVHPPDGLSPLGSLSAELKRKDILSYL